MKGVTPVVLATGLVTACGFPRALDRLDLTLRPGEVLGGDPWRDAVRVHRRLANVPGEVNLPA